jgi:hypothetical protein
MGRPVARAWFQSMLNPRLTALTLWQMHWALSIASLVLFRPGTDQYEFEIGHLVSQTLCQSSEQKNQTTEQAAYGWVDPIASMVGRWLAVPMTVRK